MGNGGATLKKRDLIVTLLYFLDMAVLILSVMFSIWMRNEFRVEALAKEITRGSFWLSMVVLAVIYACVFTLSRTYQVLWEYASMRDACIVAVCAMSSSIAFALIRTALKFPYFAPSIYIMAGSLCTRRAPAWWLSEWCSERSDASRGRALRPSRTATIP